MDKSVNKEFCNLPEIGFGVHLMNEGVETFNAVTDAVEVGFRYIDTARGYNNEKSVGNALEQLIKSNKINRKDIVISAKVNPPNCGYECFFDFFRETLSNLKLDYIDIMLIHNPMYYNIDRLYRIKSTWCAMEELYLQGKIKAIGVSNFQINDLKILLSDCKIKPQINQIELNPFHQQRELVSFCQQHDIFITAWGALGQYKVLSHPLLEIVAKKYNKTPAQICLRWGIQKKYHPLVGSTNRLHIKENYDVFDFNITDDDMRLLDTLDGDGATPTKGTEYLEYHRISNLKNDYTEWFKTFYYKRDNTPERKTYYLFSFLPILTKVKVHERKCFYKLFGIIPILKIKRNLGIFKCDSNPCKEIRIRRDKNISGESKCKI